MPDDKGLGGKPLGMGFWWACSITIQWLYGGGHSGNFPERDAKLFYKIGRWFLFLVLMLLITDFYNFSIHWSDNQKEVQREEMENDRIKKAWYYLYQQEGKAGRRLMDSAYAKSH